MAYIYGRASVPDAQEPPIVEELKALFETVPDRDLLDALVGSTRRGPKGHSVTVLWHCYLTRYYLGLPSIASLIRTLDDNPFISEVCGITGDRPSQPTFSRFFARLARPKMIVAVKNVMREMVRECYRTLPEFGKIVAIDSTDVKAWSNKAKKPFTDPDAAWAVKSTSGNLKKFWLGYKAHLLVDTRYELPVALNITRANVHDLRGATAALANARYTYKRFRPSHVLADAGYDSDPFRKSLYTYGNARPIVKARSNRKKHIEKETAEWKLFYNMRVGVERAFSRLKEHRALNHCTVQRIRKVTVHCFLSVIVMQAQALATGSRASVRKAA